MGFCRDSTVDDRKICNTLRILDYGNDGTFRIMGNAGFISSTVVPRRGERLPTLLLSRDVG